jgi:hypothetical protein
MTAAGVQTTDSAAYSPPLPSSFTSDTKGTGAAAKQGQDKQAATLQAANTSGEPSDFQNELQLQYTGTPQAKSAGPSKAVSGKSGKKRDARPDAAPLPTSTPVQQAEPPKRILPLVLALPKSNEDAKPEDPDTQAENSQESARQVVVPVRQAASVPMPQTSPVQQGVLAPATAIAASTQLPEPVQSTEQFTTQSPSVIPEHFSEQSPKPRPSAKVQAAVRSVEAPSNQKPTAEATVSATSDSAKTQIPLLATLVPVRDERTQSQDPAKPAASAESHSVSAAKTSPAGLALPVTSPEPAPEAVQETADSAPASPAALAFAARLTTSAQKADEPVSENQLQPSIVNGSQTPAQIPVRYAPMAQILSKAEAETKQGTGARKDPSIDATISSRSVRTDSTNDIPMVVPRFETPREAASNSSPAMPTPEPMPSARTETVIDLPAAPPTSAHDIRVQVPDANGGSTHVRFVESGGEVRVSVRTADTGLAQNLRTHLNDLTQRLADGGIPAETWKPASNAAFSQNDQQNNHQADPQGRGSGGQDSGGRGGQQDRQQKRPAWLDEMEASLHGAQE